MEWEKYGFVVVRTATNSMEKTETSNYWYQEAGKVEVEVCLQLVTGIGGKAQEDGGERKVVRCERRESTDRGEQKNTFMIKDEPQRLKIFSGRTNLRENKEKSDK